MSAVKLLQHHDIDVLFRSFRPLPEEVRPTLVEASRVLGYAPTVTEETQATLEGRHLVSTFKELGIRPFTRASVEQYKAKKVNDLADPPNVQIFSIAAFVFAMCCTCAFSYVYVALLLEWNWGIGLLAFATCFGLAIISKIIAVLLPQGKKMEWRWTLLHEYREEIPENILWLGIELTEALGYRPTLLVESLVEMRNAVEAVEHDPFLAVQTSDGQLYYVAVWNEPSFKPTYENLTQTKPS